MTGAPAEDRPDSATERTLLAADRTMLAWVRTSISLIGFGFTLYKFLLGTPGFRLRPEGPRRIGLLLIAVGTIPLILSLWEYWRTVRRLNPRGARAALNVTSVVAAAIAALGLMLLVTIFAHREVF